MTRWLCFSCYDKVRRDDIKYICEDCDIALCSFCADDTDHVTVEDEYRGHLNKLKKDAEDMGMEPNDPAPFEIFSLSLEEYMEGGYGDDDDYFVMRNEIIMDDLLCPDCREKKELRERNTELERQNAKLKVLLLHNSACTDVLKAIYDYL